MSAHNVELEVQKFTDANADVFDFGAGNTVKIDNLSPSTANGTVTIPTILSTSGNALQSGNVVSSGSVKSTSVSGGIGYAVGAGSAVTQLTDATTTVTLNFVCGQITTVALTTAAAAEEIFQLTNSRIAATDVVVLSTTYAGAGTPIVFVTGVAAGSCKINITNVHAANALNAVMVINFAVIKSVAA